MPITVQNQSFPGTRQALNAALSAIAGCHVGATEPTERVACMFWADLTAGLLKQRNTANTGWLIVGSLNADYFGLGARRNHIDGLTMTNSASDINNDITFGVGEAIAGSRIAVNTIATTKRLNSAWVAGTGQGGLFSGSKTANTWYHCFIMLNTTTGAVDFGFDSTFAGTGSPAGWSVRRIGAVRTSAANNILQFDQFGDWFYWRSPVLDVNDTTLSTTRKTYTISVPPGLSCLTYINNYVLNNTNRAVVYVNSPNSTDLAPSDIAAPLISLLGTATGAGGSSPLLIPTNTASQIAARALNAATTFNVSTLYYRDLRGKE